MAHEFSTVILTGITCILSIFCVVFHAVAFGTRRWLEGDGISPFLNLGFHEACFDNCREPWCPGGDDSVIFDGCWWVHDYHFENIWHWLIPEWFFNIRDIAIGIIPLTVMCLILTCASTSLVLADNYQATVKRSRQICIIVLLIFTATCLLLTGALCIVVLSQFYANSSRRDWMPMPDRNSFGYSYWLEMTTAVMLMISFMFVILSAFFKIIDMGEGKDEQFATDMMLGRS